MTTLILLAICIASLHAGAWAIAEYRRQRRQRRAVGKRIAEIAES